MRVDSYMQSSVLPLNYAFTKLWCRRISQLFFFFTKYHRRDFPFVEYARMSQRKTYQI